VGDHGTPATPLRMTLARFWRPVSLEQLLQDRCSGLSDVRLLLAVLVVFSHSWPLLLGPEAEVSLGPLQPGAMAVRAFMVLSGLLVARSARRHPPLSFLRRRLLRLYPGVLVAQLVTVLLILPLFAWAVRVPYLPSLGGDRGGLRYLLANLSLLVKQSALLPFTDLFPYKGAFNGSLWTLWPEACGYALVLLFVGLLALSGRAWLLTLAVLFTATAVPAVRGLLSLVAPPFLLVDGLTIWLGVYLVVGVLLARWAPRIPLAPLPGLLAGLVLLLLALWGGLPRVLFEAISLVLGPYGLLCLAQGLGGLGRLPGDFSYGVYVYAFPCQQMLAALLGKHLQPWSFFGLSLLLVLPLGVASWFWVERPALAWASRLDQR